MAGRDSTYFISDLHLGARYITDPRAHQARVVSFLESIAPRAQRLYMLGDVLDYWFEYRDVVPRGYVRFFGQLARMADAGTEILWMTGNHDIWLFDYLRDEIGIRTVDAPYIRTTLAGRNLILAHGDRIGPQKASFRFICSLFRNRLCQRMYAALHPRLTVPFANAWSRHSRAEGGHADVRALTDNIVATAAGLVREFPDTDYVITGHHHVVTDRPVPGTHARAICLGDWIDNCAYALLGPDGNLTLHRYK